MAEGRPGTVAAGSNERIFATGAARSRPYGNRYDGPLGPAAVRRLDEYRDAHRVLENARAWYEHAQQAATGELKEAAVSVRDTDHLMGVSHHRVAQVLERQLG
jgi:hypothetical protein